MAPGDKPQKRERGGLSRNSTGPRGRYSRQVNRLNIQHQMQIGPTIRWRAAQADGRVADKMGHEELIGRRMAKRNATVVACHGAEARLASTLDLRSPYGWSSGSDQAKSLDELRGRPRGPLLPDSDDFLTGIVVGPFFRPASGCPEIWTRHHSSQMQRQRRTVRSAIMDRWPHASSPNLVVRSKAAAIELDTNSYSVLGAWSARASRSWCWQAG